MELPVLKTDPDLDLLNFGNTDLPSFADMGIPLESVNVEEDEGFEWPKKYADFPRTWGQRSRTEKLAMTKDDLLFLRNAVTDLWAPEDLERVGNGCLDYNRVSICPTL